MMNILKKKKFWLAIVVLAAAVIVYFVWHPWVKAASTVSYALTAVKKGDLSITVSGSGQVSALKSVNITPETSGKIISVKVKNGQTVKAGNIIAVMDQRDAAADLSRARASLLSVQASYDKTLAGVAGDDLKLYKLSLESSRASYDSAVKDLATVRRTTAEAVGQAEETLANLKDESPASVNNSRAQLIVALDSKISSARGSLDKMNRLLINEDAENSLSVLNSSYLLLAKSNYDLAKNFLLEAQNKLALAKNLRSDANLQSAVNVVIDLLNNTAGVANNLFSALEKSSPTSDFAQSEIDSNKTSMSSEAGAMATAITAIQTAWQTLKDDIKEAENGLADAKLSAEQSMETAQAKIDSAKRALETAEVQYEKNIAPPTVDEIASAESSLLSAQASVRTASTAYGKTIIKAPLAGKLDGFETAVGDQVSQSSIGTIMTDQKIAVIPFNEVDTAKIKVGQAASLTFDAIPDLIIKGKVIEIASTGNVSQGIVNYDVKISLDETDERIKTEMSVSAVIIVETKTGILLVPSEAVKSQGDIYYVEAPTDNSAGFAPDNVNVAPRINFSNRASSTASSSARMIASSSSAVRTVPGQYQRAASYSGATARKIVTIGISDDTYTEITTGLGEGDRIVQKTITAPTKISGSTSTSKTGANNAGDLMRMSGTFTGSRPD
jgi:HlyD family secretion protein